MASTSSMPLEQPQAKPSFAKVAASSYKPHISKEISSNPKPAATNTRRSGTLINDAPKVRIEGYENESKDNTGSTASRTGQWANNTGQQVAFQSGLKEDETDKLRPSINLVKSLATEDNTTQLSSSDGSVKPPSLDGKSIASATTFALDEKESIRPDDSASLRAVEEEDVTSPPDSVAAGSRVGSDSGVARAFRDQLHEIAVMGPVPQRGAPPGRFPNPHANGPQTLYDPNQLPNSIGRPISQPVVSGMPNVTGPHNLPAIPDEKLIEALESPRDRLFVLKLEQDFIDFVKDSRENELSLPNCNTFYRMLAHRLADYYLLGHVVDTSMTGVKITRTPYCRIPPPLSGLPVSTKNTNTPPVDLPTRKIMRRGDDAKSGTNTTANSEGPSKTTSEAGGGSSDGGNDGIDTDNRDKSALTREEREARYREARQRIFGNAEDDGADPTESVTSGEEKDVSRSSSASGKKKNKKQRNYDDDFEARSRFNAYYPQQYPVPTFGADQTVYYGFSGQMPAPQYPGINANASPPPQFNSGYPVMMPQDAQAPYGWHGQQYQPPNGPMNFSSFTTPQNGYDLSSEFQRGMQSFQSSGHPSQVTPKMANPPMASYPDSYQQQAMPINAGWAQMNQQQYPMPQSPYAQNGPSNRPMSAPVQGPMPGQYPYGQFPSSPYNGKPNRNQHPLPGSYNRQQFNPQSQTFIPGGRNVPYQMQSPSAPLAPQAIPPQGMNGYVNFQVPMANPGPTQIQGFSPPLTHQQPFNPPQSFQNSVPTPPKSNNSGNVQTPQVANSQAVLAASSIPAQSSIAKYGTPSHLPPRPPPPAQPQPPKFNLPAHGNFSPPPRLPNNMTAGYAPAIRGGAGPNVPNKPA